MKFNLSLALLVTLGIWAIALLPTTHAAVGNHAAGGVASTELQKPVNIILLIDRSDSTRQLTPAETTQAAALHIGDLGGLSDKATKMLVIFFGGDGVITVGDEQGRPTSAHTSLRDKLVRNWPKAAGQTPMDEAFAKVETVVKDIPTDEEVVVVLITDGQPSSGYLRPNDFPDVRKELDRRRQQVQGRYKNHSPKFIEGALASFDETYATLETEEALELYESVQLPAEFKKCCEFAAALKKRGIRLVSLDLAGNPLLDEIHRAGSDRKEDLVRSNPNEIIRHLADLRITALPRVVRLPDQKFDADPNTFERTITVPLEPFAEKALIAIEFQPAVQEFGKQIQLRATVGDASYEFTTDGARPEATLALDAQGNVATATLKLDSLPPGVEVTFELTSPSGSQHAPSCTVYSYLRLRDGCGPEFRPVHAPHDAVGPFEVSSKHDAPWAFSLRQADEVKPYPLKSAEAVLRPTGSRGVERRMELTADLKTPGVFLSAPTKLAAGEYDVEIHVQLESGGSLTLRLGNHIHVRDRNEAVSIEIVPHTEESGDVGSFDPAELNFGELGDDLDRRSVDVLLRSVDIDYPLPVALDAVIADSEGRVPHDEWIKFSPSTVTLMPGKSEKVRVTLTLPKEIEDAICDGPFEGNLRIVEPQSREALRLRRFQKISGVPDDLPVERIRFELKRPRFVLSVPYAWRERLVVRDEHLETIVHDDINTFFTRDMTVVIAHDSKLPRSITGLTTSVRDPQGRQVPNIRLVPLADSETVRELAPGARAAYAYRVEVDQGCAVPQGIAELDFRGPGLVSTRLRVRIVNRQPLLAPYIIAACRWLAGGLGLSLVWDLWNWLAARRLATSVERTLTAARGLGDLLRVENTKSGVQLVSDVDLLISHEPAGRTRSVSAGGAVRIDPQTLPDSPLFIQHADDGRAPLLQVTGVLSAGEDTEVTIAVADGRRNDETLSRTKRKIVVGICLIGFCLSLAENLHQASVITATQYVYDLVAH